MLIVIKSMLGEFGRRVVKITIRDIIQMILVFLVIFSINIFLIMYVNRGLLVLPDTWIVYITAVPGTQLTVTFFWMALISLLTSLFARIKKEGIKRFYQELVASPRWLAECLSLSRGLWGIPTLLCLAFAMLVGLVVNNPITLLILALLVFLSFTAQVNGFFFSLTMLFFNGVLKYENPIMNRVISGSTGVSILGLCVGLLLYVALPLKPWVPVGLAIALIALAVLLKYRKIDHSAITSVIALLLLFLIIFKAARVFAWDGWGDALFGSERVSAGKAAAQSAAPSAIGSLWSFFSKVTGIDFFFGERKPVPGATEFVPSGKVDPGGLL